MTKIAELTGISRNDITDYLIYIKGIWDNKKESSGRLSFDNYS